MNKNSKRKAKELAKAFTAERKAGRKIASPPAKRPKLRKVPESRWRLVSSVTRFNN